MGIETPYLDKAIELLRGFKSIALTKGFVAQGFGKHGYWDDNDLKDDRSRELMQHDFYQYGVMYEEIQRKMNETFFCKRSEIKKELQGLLYNSDNFEVALRLKINQFRDSVMPNFEKQVCVPNDYYGYTAILKNNGIVPEEATNAYLDTIDSLGLHYMQSVNDINNAINEILESLGKSQEIIPNLFVIVVDRKAESATVSSPMKKDGHEEETSSDKPDVKKVVNRGGRRDAFRNLKEKTLAGLIDYTIEDRAKAEIYATTIQGWIKDCKEDYDQIAALAVAMEEADLICILDGGRVDGFSKMIGVPSRTFTTHYNVYKDKRSDEDTSDPQVREISHWVEKLQEMIDATHNRLQKTSINFN